ncbi:MAG TPA: pyruvate, phosphate dikinase [Cyanobacteria bacterium UBA11991]|nr:pyruvate, phosphate dikinase [Cyanobacteriota bacterium]MDY6382473.1 pyruvate, phosphate dikinase [Cyanobacteriota bacterium]HCB10619.1 pyruvate, phosphate dikinase [Cyanobacteria bacterium UBA11991]
MTEKRVFLFREGNAHMRAELGGKGANLAEMTNLGLPVPPGLTITTATCMDYINNGNKLPDGLMDEVKYYLKDVEKQAGKKFGDKTNPLLVSVRSGARVSMPGMMETILNLGLNDETVEAMVKLTNNPRFCYDSYRRFLTMFGSVAWDMDRQKYFESEVEKLKEKEGVKEDTEISAEGWKSLIPVYKKTIKEVTGKDFPQDPYVQLQEAIEAVFRSWNIPRAVAYRNMNKIDHNYGTAVNVQTMVFGNMGNDCATGVSFTRNPATGENKFYGEYLVNAQGEDVVAGIRTPKPIAELETDMPDIYKQYVQIAKQLEKGYHDVQDMEFTVERGKLWILQTRNGKRTAKAAIKIAVDMHNEGIISKDEAIMQVDPYAVYQVLLPCFNPAAVKHAHKISKGVNASPGAAVGKIVFDTEEAAKRGAAGEKVILVRIETCPDDIHGMAVSQGVLTLRGGATSHAAVVAKGMGKPCVSGCEDLKIDMAKETVTCADGTVFHKNDIISLDGGTGDVMEGAIELVDAGIDHDFETFFGWVNEIKQLKVEANADTPKDIENAKKFGAEGVGLCRTEHMFMDPERLPWVQKMIIAGTKEARKEALEHILPMQYNDFYAMFKALGDKPLTVRLLDPPLHEFLPSKIELIERVATKRALGQDYADDEKMLATVEKLSESNPMMGLRGCRLGLTFPEINEMQVRAIFSACCDLAKEGYKLQPWVMVPLVGHINELKIVKDGLVRVAEEVMKEKGVKLNYKFGTMIEIPRAALTAKEIATEAEFFSYGTNDLTQMTFGYSRDDAEGKFLKNYVEQKILPFNPFVTLDQKGVGRLIEMSINEGREVNPSLVGGICGEHGGDPDSVKYAHRIGLNYVSCSPYRIPQARLAAAQAVIESKQTAKV